MTFGAYIVGTWEKRLGIHTYLHIINPTLIDPLSILVAFFDHGEQVRMCIKETLSSNDLCEIDVSANLPNLEGYGLVKIFSHQNEIIQPGIVGYQRRALLLPGPGGPEASMALAFAESPLTAVQDWDEENPIQNEYEQVRNKCIDEGLFIDFECP